MDGPQRSRNPVEAFFSTVVQALTPQPRVQTGAVTVLGECHKANSASLAAHLKTICRFTYRRNMPPLEPYSYTSDAGWGCMIRCSQMLLCNALRIQMFGKDWRVGAGLEDVSVLRENVEYVRLTSWFLDLPCYPHIFGLHMLSCAALRYNVLPGEWVGPHTASFMLRDLAHLHRCKYKGPLEVHVASGGVVYMEEIDSAASAESSGGTPTPSLRAARRVSDCFDPLLNPPPEATVSETLEGWSCSLLLLIPLRLGVKSIDPNCIDELVTALNSKLCIGMLGGTPRHALYLVGSATVADDSKVLLGFDPHSVENAFSSSTPFPSEDLVHSLHCGTVSYIDITRLDPCVSLGFLFKSRGEYLSWCQERLGRPSLLFTVQRYSVQEASPREAELPSSDDDDDDWVKI